MAKPESAPDARQANAPAIAPDGTPPEEAIARASTSAQPAMSAGCAAHWRFDSVRPRSVTEKAAVKSVFDWLNTR